MTKTRNPSDTVVVINGTAVNGLGGTDMVTCVPKVDRNSGAVDSRGNGYRMVNPEGKTYIITIVTMADSNSNQFLSNVYSGNPTFTLSITSASTTEVIFCGSAWFVTGNNITHSTSIQTKSWVIEAQNCTVTNGATTLTNQATN